MLYRGGRSSRGTRVYVGGLVGDVKRDDLEVEFEKFGKLNNVWVAFNPPGFAFVEFSKHDDAEAACAMLNDSDMFGSKLKVEISRGRGRGRGRGMIRGGQGGFGEDRGFRGFRPRGRGFHSRGSYERNGTEKGYRGGRGGRGNIYDDGGFGGRSGYSSRDFGGRPPRGSSFRGSKSSRDDYTGGFGSGRETARYRSRSPISLGSHQAY